MIKDIISPFLLSLVYFSNLCLLHNLYHLFDTGSSYINRIRKYSLFGTLIIVVIIVIIFFGKFKEIVNAIYILGLCFFVYVVMVLYSIYKYENNFFSMSQGEYKQLLSNFFKNYTLYVLFFIVCYLPNNIIQVLHRFWSFNIESFLYLYPMCCAPILTFCVKMSEQYMKKYYTSDKNWRKVFIII